MTSNQDDSRITDYVFDELAPDARRAFEAELQADPELAQLVEETRGTVETLATELNTEAAEPMGLSASQRETLRAATKPGPPVTDAGSTRLWMTLAIAASLLLVGGLVWGVSQSGDPPTVAQNPQSGTSRNADASSGSQSPDDLSLVTEESETAEGLVKSVDRQSTTYASGPGADAPASTPAPTGSSNDSSNGVSPESAQPQTTRLAVQPAQPADETLEAAPSASVDLKFAYGIEPTRKKEQLQRFSRRLNPLPSGEPAPMGFDVEIAGESQVELFDDLRSGLRGPGGDRDLREVGAQEVGAKEADGRGPGRGGDQHDPIVDNPFMRVVDAPLSTFSIDVDTAAYSKARMYLMQHGALPRPDVVRIEELVNYFPYGYEPPAEDAEHPFQAHMAIADCPWNPEHRLARIAIKGKEFKDRERPSSNLVFLLDVSGSMDQPNKLPLLKRGMKMLVDGLGENDRVAIVVYAGAAGLVLDSTNGSAKSDILGSLERLKAGGSTNGGDGIRLAYQVAMDNFIQGGVNRVILCTDGDFNVGTTGTDQLVRLAEENAKSDVFLSVLGFGMGNHNDAMLEQISNKGNGNYAFIDTDAEAHKVLVEQMEGTLVTIAKDVKIQIEFNPTQVAGYRLIGYENRILAAEDFNDDTKDAGEIGAGHSVTALYELVPAAAEGEVLTQRPPVDELRYLKPQSLTEAAESDEMLVLKLRYKQPEEDVSQLLTQPVVDPGKRFGEMDQDFQFAASVASFGMLLRNSPYKGDSNWDAILEIASNAADDDATGYRAEFLEMVERAKQLSGQ